MKAQNRVFADAVPSSLAHLDRMRTQTQSFLFQTRLVPPSPAGRHAVVAVLGGAEASTTSSFQQALVDCCS